MFINYSSGLISFMDPSSFWSTVSLHALHINFNSKGLVIIIL